jgi:hypothetical protein
MPDNFQFLQTRESWVHESQTRANRIASGYELRVSSFSLRFLRFRCGLCVRKMSLGN